MKNFLVLAGSLTFLTALAEAMILLQTPLDPVRLAAALGSLALILAAFAGLTQAGVVKQLRLRAASSGALALGMPFLLLVPYFVYGLGTGTFSWHAVAKLSAYIAAPTLLLLPQRSVRTPRMGWRDIAAMVALALPISAGWMRGIWTWPQESYFFRPLVAVSVGGYAFLVLRRLEDVGFRLGFRRGDVIDGLSNFVAFALLAIPLGLALGFIRPHGNPVSFWQFGLQFFGTYLTIAIPEELLFRGFLQNLLVKTIPHPRRGLYGLLIAAVVFGASHLHHPPAPNWKYALLATLAGIFYGNAYRTRHRLSASALTHALVDTTWHFWF